jgi:hypothetical protein
MANGPRGERRPADVIGNAVHVMRIATGQPPRVHFCRLDEWTFINFKTLKAFGSHSRLRYQDAPTR